MTVRGFRQDIRRLAAACLAGLALVGAGPAAGTATSKRSAEPASTLREVRAKAEKYIDYENAIPLTAAQARVKAEALKGIPAPCCKDYSMLTCCCPCNLAKSVWGLSHYLIAKKSDTAPQVKAEVLRWLAAINPAGFTGNACFNGGCKRPFSKNGCGGMEATEVIVGDEVR